MKIKYNNFEKNYWVNKLQVFEECTKVNMGTENLESDMQENVYNITEELYKGLMKITNGNPMALYVIFLSSVQIVLSKYNSEKIIILSPCYDFEKNDESAVVIPVELNFEQSFREFLKNVKSKVIECYQHQNFPIQELLSSLKMKSILDITEVGCSLSNLHNTKALENFGLNLILELTMEEERIQCLCKYKNLEEDFVERFFKQICTALTNCLNDSKEKLKNIHIINDEEKALILNEFNKTKVEYPSDKCVKELFNEIVSEYPEQIAIQSHGNTITYQQFSQKANQIAHYLRKKGVGRESFVAVVCDRSMETVFAIMGIIKAGAVYVPINEDYPQQRLDYIIEDSQSKIVIGKKKVLGKFVLDNRKVDIIDIEDKVISNESVEELVTVNESRDLIYIMYTSGTTGNPKGVCIEHRGVIRLVQGQKYTVFHAGGKIFQTGSIAFDASTIELWGAFLNGLTICVEDKNLLLNPNELKKYLQENNVTNMFMTTALFHQICNIDASVFDRLEYLLVGGDALSADPYNLFRKHNCWSKFNNVYGPTENTALSSYFELDSDRLWELKRSIPIGKPISNSTAYVMDKFSNLLPIGVPGELWVGGDGVGRNYLNREDLTKEKFVENPYVAGEPAYKTGDLVKWLPDGNIEFLGRIDNQVKIRGFRIETGEIERTIFEHDQVKEAAVVVKKDEHGEKYLCAYYSGRIDVDLLKLWLEDNLPSYMIPAYFMKMDKLPINYNGKIDKKNLPEIEKTSNTKEYEKPENEIQEKMASVFSFVLGVDRISILDNFYNLGGDSIKAIQIASRLKSLDIKVDIKDILQFKCIREISKRVKQNKTTIAQQPVEGEILLTPVMHKYIEMNRKNMDHFNQSFLLLKEDGFDVSYITAVMEKLVEHHDVLRAVLQEKDGVCLYNRQPGEKCFEISEYQLAQEDEYEKALEEKAEQLQQAIDVRKGPLIRIGLFHTAGGDYLLFIINHLIVDGVSWRIIIEDFESLYTLKLNQEELELSLKTSSFRDWAQKLSDYAQGSFSAKELDYWNRIKFIQLQQIKEDRNTKHSAIGNMETKKLIMGEAITDKLLYQVNKAFNTEINDILLSILACTVKEWNGNTNAAVLLEGHGRESLFEDIDITRTVGWFTSCYPVVLNMTQTSIEGIVKETKEIIRKIPNKGVGYGILQYLSGNDIQIDTEISFNYLGKLEKSVKKGKNHIMKSDLATGSDIGNEFKFHEGLQVNCIVENDCFMIQVSFDKQIYHEVEINTFMSILEKNFYDVVDVCASKETTELTPFDYGVNHCSINELEKLKAYISSIYGSEAELEKLNQLSSMQEGMLLSYLKEMNTTGYIVQMVINVHGNLHVSQLEKAYYMLEEKYEVLRTNIFYQKGQDVQAVIRNKPYKITYLDYRSYPDKDAELNKLKNTMASNGFDLERENLFQLYLVRVGDKEHKLLIHTHHIILDGWSLGILINELFKFYECADNFDEAQQVRRNDYSDYLAWLFEKDFVKGYQYWNKYLEDYVFAGELPKREDERLGYWPGVLHYEFEEALTKKLEKIALENEITMNIVCQFAWGILLQKYLDSKDVVFGTVVSGRTPEIDGIEEMVGLFINTIPVRVRTKTESTIITMLKEMNEASQKSKEYEYLSLAEIQQQSDAKQNLCAYLYAFENFPIDENQKEQSITYEVESGREETDCDINLSFILKDKLKMKVMYNQNAFDKETIDKLFEGFSMIFETIVQDLTRPIKDISILTEDEERLILEEFNNTESVFPNDKCIVELFEEVVERVPDNTAIVLKDKKITYRELNELANSVARKLRKLELKPDDFIAICGVRSIEQIISMIAVLKAGAAFVPISPDYPEERIDYILNDCKPKVILTYQTKLKNTGIPQISLDDEESYTEDKNNLDIVNKPEDLSYVIYTSGTTGKPKGVMIENRGVVNLAYDYISYYGIEEEDNVLLFFDICFDGAVADIYMTLLKGASLYMIDKELQMDQVRMKEYTKEVTVMCLTPQYFNALEVENKRLIITAGAETNKDIVQRARNAKALYSNAYGPTEATVASTHWMCNQHDILPRKIPIGKPISNKKVYIMQDNILCGVNIPGEICVAGEGIARGYLNREQLSKEKFVKNPFGEGRMYRTGDLGRWTRDGNVDYMGRLDDQVKIRGYRIELAEIENNLLLIDGIREVSVLVKEQGEDKFLCAFYKSDIDYNTDELRNQLKAKIPAYMVPSRFVKIDEMSLTINGKIDKKALECLDIMEKEIKNSPTTELEKKILAIWKEVLGEDDIGINDNFFDIGGHSITAMKAMTKIRKDNHDITINTIFEYPTIEELAATLENTKVVQADDCVELSRFTLTDENSQSALKRKMQERADYYKQQLDKELNKFYASFGKKDGVNFLFSNTEKMEWERKEDANSLCECTLHGEIDVEKLREAVRYAIQTFDVLRRVIERKENSVCWKQFDITLGRKLYIPHFELAAEDVRIQGHIQKELLQASFIRKYKEDEVLYRILLISKSSKEYFLYLPIHHIIFDGSSNNVLGTKIKEYYRKLVNEEKNIDTSNETYQQYQEQILKGPVHITADEIINRYHLNEYESRSKELHIRLNDNKYEYGRIMVKIPLSNLDMEEFSKYSWNLSCNLLKAFVEHYVGVSEVPMEMISMGRRYENRNFYRTLGKCIDRIPVLLTERQGNSTFNEVHELIHCAELHNINFTHMKNRDIQGKEFDRVARLLHTFADDKRYCNIILNYLGHMYTDQSQVKEYLVDCVEQKDTDVLAAKSIGFTISYTDEFMFIEGYTFLFDTKDKMSDFLKNQFSKILGKFLIV